MKLSTENPLVSIIILCYNQAEIIGRAIKSVLNQTYENIQLVIVDDCSWDNSREVIISWQQQYPGRIKIFFQPSNVGHPANMNTGYKLCDGELVTFCDGDDWYFPEKIEREVGYLKAHSEVDVVHSNFDFYTFDGTFIRHWAADEKAIPVGDIFPDLFALNYPHKCHLRYELTSRKIIEETGLYDVEIPIWVDWDFRLRLAADHRFGYCHHVGSAYTDNPDGLTNVLKQEIILRCLNTVIEKNKRSLDKYPPPVARKSEKAIRHLADRLSLSVNYHKGKNSLFETAVFIWRYPSSLRQPKIILNSLLGKKLMESLSAVKQKLKAVLSLSSKTN